MANSQRNLARHRDDFHWKKENAFPAKQRGECRRLGSAGRQFRKLLASRDKPSRVPIASAFCTVIKRPFLKGETRRIVYAKFQKN